ncbi:MAG: molybdate ABC transporter substrate-binding protein [Kiloniellaceae bacterium]
MRRALRRLAGFAAVAVLGLSAGAPRAEEVTLFAAASTTNAVNAVAEALGASGLGPLRPVFAASSTLAQQIARGAPADLVLSANSAWMDFLAARGAIEGDSRVDLLGNRLVLIAPAKATLALEVETGFPLAAALGKRRLAMGDPGHVPAGIYAKAALEGLGVWPEVAAKAAFAADVRAALALVDRGEAAAGIVYATDAAISSRVRVVARFPAESHPEIAYTLAVVAGRRGPAVSAVYEFLRGPEAGAIFRAHGFTTPGRGG